MSAGRSVRKAERREKSRTKANGPSGNHKVTLMVEGSGQTFPMLNVRRATGIEAGQNNRNLAMQETSVESIEMGTILTDGSHLCF
jgi:hypothetical protein